MNELIGLCPYPLRSAPCTFTIGWEFYHFGFLPQEILIMSQRGLVSKEWLNWAVLVLGKFRHLSSCYVRISFFSIFCFLILGSGNIRDPSICILHHFKCIFCHFIDVFSPSSCKIVMNVKTGPCSEVLSDQLQDPNMEIHTLIWGLKKRKTLLSNEHHSRVRSTLCLHVYLLLFWKLISQLCF